MSERLPVVSDQQLIKALEKTGWVVVRHRGSHVRLKHDERTTPLVIPLHRELKRGTQPHISRHRGGQEAPARLRCLRRNGSLT